LALIVSLFFLWGGANNLNDVLIAQFKKAFVLSDFGAGLVQSAFYLGYFLVAMPAGMYMRRFGYKSAVVFGLLLYGLGALLFWPAASQATYGLFLFALFVAPTPRGIAGTRNHGPLTIPMPSTLKLLSPTRHEPFRPFLWVTFLDCGHPCPPPFGPAALFARVPDTRVGQQRKVTRAL